MTRRYALRDDQWERIKDLLPGRAFPLLSHCRRTIGCWWKLCSTEIGQEFPGVISNPPFIGIIHLSVLELCVLERTLWFNHSNASGIDMTCRKDWATCFLVHTRTAPMLKEWGVGGYVRSRIAQDADNEYARN